MDEQQLRAEWEKRLVTNFPEVRDDLRTLDELWSDQDSDLIRYAHEHPKQGLEDLVTDARKQLKYWRRGLRHALLPELEEGKEGEYTSEEVVLQHAADKNDRSAAFSEYLALAATLRSSELKRFRGKVLSGKLLTPEQAHALVEAPSAAHFPVGWFKKFGVPVVGHTAIFEMLPGARSDKEGSYTLARVHVDPPGITRLTRCRPLITLREGEPHLEDVPTLDFPHRSGERNILRPGRRHVRSDSVLDELREVSTELSSLCQPWDEAEAAWFTLTGEFPTVSGVRGRAHFTRTASVNYGNMILIVEPWVSGDSVRRAYLDLQRQVLGRKNRSISERNLAVFRFVVRETVALMPSAQMWQLPSVRFPSWRELRNRWNEQVKQEWRYEDARYFRRDFRRASKLVVRPRYNTVLHSEAR